MEATAKAWLTAGVAVGVAAIALGAALFAVLSVPAKSTSGSSVGPAAGTTFEWAGVMGPMVCAYGGCPPWGHSTEATFVVGNTSSTAVQGAYQNDHGDCAATYSVRDPSGVLSTGPGCMNSFGAFSYSGSGPFTFAVYAGTNTTDNVTVQFVGTVT